MHCRSVIWLVAGCSACSFDQTGIERGGSNALGFDGTALQSVRELAVTPASDAAALPTSDAEADALGAAKAAPRTIPISAVTLGDTLHKTRVECLNSSGKTDSDTRVADSNEVTYYEGSLTLANATSAVAQWAGAGPWVTVAWDPNACGDQFPFGRENDWESAGLLIRGASLDAQGKMVLAPATTTADINLIDIWEDGRFDRDVAGPNDSELTAYPQLLTTVSRAKALILDLAGL